MGVNEDGEIKVIKIGEDDMLNKDEPPSNEPLSIEDEDLELSDEDDIDEDEDTSPKLQAHDQIAILLDGVVNPARHPHITERVAKTAAHKEAFEAEFGYLVQLPGESRPPEGETQATVKLAADDEGNLMIASVIRDEALNEGPHNSSSPSSQKWTASGVEGGAPPPPFVEAGAVDDAPGALIDVDISKLTLLAEEPLLNQNAVERLLTDLLSSSHSRFGYDAPSLQRSLMDLQHTLVGENEPASRLLAGLPPAGGLHVVPVTSLEIKPDWLESLRRLNAIAGDKKASYTEKLRLVEHAAAPYAPPAKDSAAFLIRPVAPIQAFNLATQSYVRLLPGDPFIFLGVAAHPSAPQFNKSFNFNAYAAALAALKQDDPVLVVFNASDRPIEPTTVLDLQGGLLQLKRENGDAYQFDTLTMTGGSVSIFPKGFEPLPKKLHPRRADTKDLNVLSFLLPTDEDEARHYIKHTPKDRTSRAPTATQEWINPLLPAPIPAPEDTPPIQLFQFPADRVARRSAASQARLQVDTTASPVMSMAQFIIMRPPSCIMSLPARMFPVKAGALDTQTHVVRAADGTLRFMAAKDQPLHQIENWLDVVGPLNDEVPAFKPLPTTPLTPTPKGMVYSTEHRRITKYSGDIDLPDEDVLLATYEELSSNYNYTERPPKDSEDENQLESVAERFLSAAGGRVPEATDVRKVSALSMFFTERALQNKYNQLLRANNSRPRPATRPAYFELSADLYAKMASVHVEDTDVMADVMAQYSTVLPAAIKVMVRSGHLVVTNSPAKEQYKVVDTTYVAMFLGPKARADAKQAISHVNDNARVIARMDHIVKGIVSSDASYLNMSFPDARYAANHANTTLVTPYVTAMRKAFAKLTPLRLQPGTGKPLPSNAVLIRAIADEKVFEEEDTKDKKDLSQTNNIRTEMVEPFRFPELAVLPERAKADAAHAKRSKPIEYKAPKPAREDFYAVNEKLFGSKASAEDIERTVLEPLFDRAPLDASLRAQLTSTDPATVNALVHFVAHRLNAILPELKVKEVALVTGMALADARTACLAAIVSAAHHYGARKDVVGVLSSQLAESLRLFRVDGDALKARFERMREDFNQNIYGAIRGLDKEERNVYVELLDARLVNADNLHHHRPEPMLDAPGLDNEFIVSEENDGA